MNYEEALAQGWKWKARSALASGLDGLVMNSLVALRQLGQGAKDEPIKHELNKRLAVV